MIRRPPRSTLFPYRRSSDLYRRDPIRRGQLSEHTVVLDEVDDGIVLRTDASDSEVFDRDRKSTRLNSSHANNLVCRLLLEKKKNQNISNNTIIHTSASIAVS